MAEDEFTDITILGDTTRVVAKTCNAERELYPHQKEALVKLASYNAGEAEQAEKQKAYEAAYGIDESPEAKAMLNNRVIHIAHNRAGKTMERVILAQALGAALAAGGLSNVLADSIVNDNLPEPDYAEIERRIMAFDTATPDYSDFPYKGRIPVEGGSIYTQQFGRAYRPRPPHIDNGTSNAIAKRRKANKAARKARRHG